MYMSAFYKMKQQVPNGCWGMRLRRSFLESMVGVHQSLVNRKTAPYSELEIVVASCGFKASTPELYLESN